MKRVLLEHTFVLHRRAYRETSFLVELFTQTHGRLTVIAKGVRKARANISGLLQPFFPLLTSFSGRYELMSLTHVEPAGEAKRLEGECLFAGLYLNELLMNLLHKWDPHPTLYAAYEETLIACCGGRLKPSILRSFEKQLLEELGYGLLPKSMGSLHNMFRAEQYYRFTQEEGFVVSEFTQQSNVFLGKNLLAIAKEEWQQESLQDAKRLIRIVMAPLLGRRPLHSRRLFMQPEEEKNVEQ